MSNETIPISNTWKEGQVTKKGIGLLSKLIMGHTLTLTRAVVSDVYMTADELKELEEFPPFMQEASFYPTSDPENGRCLIACVISNEKNEVSYVAKTIVIGALDPDEGEIPFFVCGSRTDVEGTGIPAPSLVPRMTATWNFYVYYVMADGVKVEVNPEGLATFEMMKQYIADTYRPMTDEEIIEAFGAADIIDGGGGIVATTDHARLRNRDLADQHPMSAITGLEQALSERLKIGTMTADEMEAQIEELWDAVYGTETATT